VRKDADAVLALRRAAAEADLQAARDRDAIDRLTTEVCYPNTYWSATSLFITRAWGCFVRAGG